MNSFKREVPIFVVSTETELAQSFADVFDCIEDEKKSGNGNKGNSKHNEVCYPQIVKIIDPEYAGEFYLAKFNYSEEEDNLSMQTVDNLEFIIYSDDDFDDIAKKVFGELFDM